MINIDTQLKKLEDWQTKEPLLSLCIGKEGVDAPSKADLLTQFHSLVHTKLFALQEKLFRDGLERFEKYIVESFDSHAVRSVALFTDGKGWWEVLEMEFFVEPFCLVGVKPYLDSVKKELGKHNRYLVLLVDQEKARLFTVNQGLIEEKKDFADVFVPQQGASKMKDDLERHLTAVAKAANQFVQGKKINFVIVGGHEEIIPKMKKQLLYPLDRLVKAEMIIGLNTPLNEIFLKSKKIAANINRG